MKTFLLIFALALLPFTPAPAQSARSAMPNGAWTDRSRVLPDKLRQVPLGLTLWHTSNPGYPEPNPEQPGQFVWKHDTSLRAEVADLEIVEVGSFIWYNESGWQPNRYMQPAEFAATFKCPGGQLRRGRTYTYANNNRYAANARQLYGGDALWYVLAKDKSGKLYKGMGLIETEATVR